MDSKFGNFKQGRWIEGPTNTTIFLFNLFVVIECVGVNNLNFNK